MSFSLLIIDDDEDIRLILTSVMSSIEGLEIFEAGTGSEAKQMLLSEKIDGIILDYQLPDVSGEELLGDFSKQSDYGSPEVIMLSARDDVSIQKKWLDMGALAVLKKPFNPFEILLEVRSHFDF